MDDQSPLLEAHDLVHGPRGDSYDHPHTDYSRTVDIFNAVTGHNLTAAEGVLFMHAVKMSRIGRGMQAAFTPGEMRDSIVDAAGYIECFWMTLEKENPRGHLQP